MEKNDRFGAHLPKTVSAKLCAAPANLSPGSFDPLGGSMHFVEVQQKTGSAANRLGVHEPGLGQRHRDPILVKDRGQGTTGKCQTAGPTQGLRSHCSW